MATAVVAHGRDFVFREFAQAAAHAAGAGNVLQGGSLYGLIEVVNVTLVVLGVVDLQGARIDIALPGYREIVRRFRWWYATLPKKPMAAGDSLFMIE